MYGNDVFKQKSHWVKCLMYFHDGKIKNNPVINTPEHLPYYHRRQVDMETIFHKTIKIKSRYSIRFKLN